MPKLIITRYVSFLLTLAIIIIAVIIDLADPQPLREMRLKLFDQYQRLQPREYTEVPVVIVDIDEESLNRLGQWPWPRNMLANLTRKLTQHGIAAAGFDMVFAEPDRTSPRMLIPKWKEFLGKAIPKDEAIPDYDEEFAAAIAEGNIVSGYVLSDTAFSMPAKKFGLVIKGDDPSELVYPYGGAISNLPMLVTAARGNGAFNAIPDTDGLIRKVPLLLRVRDQLIPSLSAELLRVAQGASTYIITATKAGISQVKIGDYTIPTDKHGQLWVHYTSYKPERYIPAWEVLDKQFDPSRLQGKLVLIGTSAAGLKDIRSTPLDPVTNGVEIHAQALEQMLSSHFLERPDWLEIAELGGMMIGGMLIWVVLTLTSPYIGAICTFLLIALNAYLSWIDFTHYHMLIDPLSPTLVMMVIYGVESLRGYIATEKERAHVRNVFSHYISPALVKKLTEQRGSIKLGGEMKDMTILFCDIRGFTTISEQFDAQGLTKFINSFLTPMTNIILEHKGTIDKYIGDCIMAFWNAPLDDANHAEHGCRAALAMIKGLRALNEERTLQCSNDYTAFIPVNIGIGLNTDRCCVGNMGSDQRFDYSVLGDGVNLASRLEGQSKHYGMSIVIGQKTKDALHGFATVELDLIKVKGKTEAVHIYGLIGDDSLAKTPEWVHYSALHEAMMNEYRSQQWHQALMTCDLMEAHAKTALLEISDFIALYRERIMTYLASPPIADWDGVYIAVNK